MYFLHNKIKTFSIFAATDNKTSARGISCGRIGLAGSSIEKTEKPGRSYIVHYSASEPGAEVSKKSYTWKGKSFAEFIITEKRKKTERKNIEIVLLFLHPVLFY